MKTIFSILLIGMLGGALAQIPAGYYDAAEGLSGDALKAALHEIIDGHTEFSYSSSSTDTWDILKVADRDPNNVNNVLCVYSGFSRNGAEEFNDGNGWNREHVWPQSRGDFGTSRGTGTDVHNLRAADVSTNSARSNRNFVASCETEYIDGDGATGSSTCGSVFGWEPRDDVKGDVARILFYMATRYEGENDEPDLELTETLQSQSAKDPLHATLSVLLAWHELDPVSDFETDRNDAIYGFQGNRNPFIDHPEWVDLVFGEDDGEVPLSVVENDFSELSIFPNPLDDGIGTILFGEGVSGIFTIRDQHGAVLSQVSFLNQISLDLSGYANGVYLVSVLSDDGEKAVVRVVR